MANTRSGSQQTLTVGGVAMHGVGTGFSGLSLSQESATFETTSGGLTSIEDGGYRVNTGEFTVNETDVTQPALLGKNGARVAVVWNDGSTDHSFNAIMQINHVYNPRAQRTFAVSLMIDGSIN